MRHLIVILAVLILTSCNSSQPDKTVRYDYEELLKKQSSELRIIRNEIFARHGYIFKSKDLAEYFGKQKWYKPQYDNVESYLTAEEKEYVKVILKAEKYVKRFASFNNFLSESSMTTIGNVKFPMELDYFIELFGNPDSTFIDPSRTCPIGQLHYWNLDQENFRIIVLGDKYGEPVTFETETRLLVFQRIQDKPSNFFEFNNIQLNDSEKLVRENIESFIAMNPEFEFEILEHKTIIDYNIATDFNKTYWMTDKQIYFHFVFDKQGKLEYIVETNINVRAVC